MLTTIGQQSQSMHADAAGLMVSNCANCLVTAGWQCMNIWLSSDVPVLATLVLSCLSVSLKTDNSLPPPHSARLAKVTTYSSLSIAQIVSSTAGSVTDICGTSARRQELDDDAFPMYMTSA